MNGQEFGVIGLEVMGRNLALNIERNGFSVSVYNRTWAKTQDFLNGPAAGRRIIAARSIDQLVAGLRRPRRILIMVKAGAAVDAVLGQLTPHLDRDDIVIDGGNSLYTDTERRAADLAGPSQAGIHFIGMGISGGEEGALWGPSLMPGGADEQVYRQLQPVLEKIAAKTEDGPCVTWIGGGGSGHYVKMVHNGIEYADMQLIAEAYDLMRRAGLDNARMREVFGQWNRGPLRSFLIEITERVIDFPDPEGTGRPLVEMILDQAGQKGTGRWTVQEALELGVPIPTIAAAVDARSMSALKGLREEASAVLAGPGNAEEFRNADFGMRNEDQSAIPNPQSAIPLQNNPQSAVPLRRLVEDLGDALYCSKICCYAQGMAMLGAANEAKQYGMRLDEIARIWKGGCIIRAALLDEVRRAFAQRPEVGNLLLAERFREALAPRQAAWRRIVQTATEWGIPVPATAASLAYYDTLRARQLPANLIQAQRDYFGAHTYQRIDRPGTFHTRW